MSLFRLSANAVAWLQQLRPQFKAALAQPFDVVGHLRSLPVFSELKDAELEHLAGYVGLAHYPPGEVLYRQGEHDPTLYILTGGGAVIRTQDEKGRMRPRGYLRPGNAIGETSLFLGDPHDSTVEAVVDSDWLYLTRADLDQFLGQHATAERRLGLREEIQTRQRLRRFAWLDEDELMVLRRRRHWFFLASRLLLPLLLLLGAVAVFLFQFGNALVFLLLAVGLPWMAWRVVDWANDYYVVTNKRVAHREKVLLISERRDETPLDKIQNMNIARNFWGNHLGFGILVIDTAAAAGAQRVVFDYLDDPEEVQRRIFEQVARLQAGERLETRRAIRDKLDAGIGVSVRPVVPHPCVPVPEDEQTPPSGPNLWQRFANATWRRWLWVEQQEGDQIIWRKHPIRLLAKTWAPGLVGAVLTVVLVLFLAARDRQWAVVFGLVVTLLLVGIWLWWNFENWGNDQYIVTTDRIIDIEALPLGFRSRRTETTFDRIQNVSYDIPHPVATILNYGTVTIFTAGAVGKLDFEFVRNPKTVQAEIFRRLSAYEARQRREQREQRWADMPEWFAEYDSRHRS